MPPSDDNQLARLAPEQPWIRWHDDPFTWFDQHMQRAIANAFTLDYNAIIGTPRSYERPTRIYSDYDGHTPYQDHYHGQWGAFFYRADMAYQYRGGTGADAAFDVSVTPVDTVRFHVFQGLTMSRAMLHAIGVEAHRLNRVSLVAFGHVEQCAIIGLLPSLTGEPERFAPGYPRNNRPSPAGRFPFRIVVGYQFAVCPSCHMAVAALVEQHTNLLTNIVTPRLAIVPHPFSRQCMNQMYVEPQQPMIAHAIHVAAQIRRHLMMLRY